MVEQQHDHGHGRAASTADEPLQVGILAASDRGARGERADVSGPTIHNLVADRLGGKVAQYKVVPDDRTAIEITSKRGNAVLMSADEYAAWQETAYLFRSPANARRLLDAAEAAERGDTFEHPLDRA